MKELSVSESVSNGWELAKQHGLLLAVFVLVISIITGLISSFAFPSDFTEQYLSALQSKDVDALQRLGMQLSSGNTIVSMIEGIIEVLFYAGFYATILKLARGIMTKVSFEGFKMEAMTYVKYFAVNIIVSLILVVGYCLCIIPGIFLTARLAFVDWYILDHPEAGIGEAFKASWNMTKGNFWSVLGLLLTEIGIYLLGFLCCCIGFYFAVPFALFAECSAYMTLHENLAYDNLDYTAPVNEYQKNEQ